MEDSGLTSCGTVDFTEAKRLKAALEERGILLELKHNPETCTTGGCSPTVEIHIRTADLPAFQAFLQEEHRRSMGDLQHDASLLGEVYDSEKQEARCPACGTQFSTSLTECPDCGLCFA